MEKYFHPLFYENLKISSLAFGIVLLLVGSFFGMNSEYYEALRFMVSLITGYFIYFCSKMKSEYKIDEVINNYFLIPILVIYNPIIKFYTLHSDAWSLIDFITAVIFIVLMTKIYNQNKNPKVVAIKETYRFWGSEYSPNDISSIIEVTNRYRQKLKQKIHNHTDLLEARIAYNIYLLVIKRTHNSRDTYLYQDHLKARYYRAILFTFYHCRSEEKSDFDMFNELDDLGNNGMSVEKVLIAKAMTHFLWASSETENVSHIKKTVEYLKKLEDSSKRKNELMESVIYFQRNTSKIPGHIAFTSIINAAGLLDEL